MSVEFYERSGFKSFDDFNQNFDPENLQVTRLVDGIGFGHGGISRYEIESAPGNHDLADVVDAAVRSPRLLVPVGRHDSGEIIQDDGCPDGRPVQEVIRGGQLLKTSLHRPKVFGGGTTATAATHIGLGISQGRDLIDVFGGALTHANQAGIEVGAHTDSNAHGKNCGCGAIDKAPEIVLAVSRYRHEISQAVPVLIGHAPELETKPNQHQPIEYGVLDNYLEAAVLSRRHFAGRVVMQAIMSQGAVVKRLAYDHRETRIVWNQVPGYTVDQAYIREQTNGRAQVFAVDEWRMRDIAASLYGEPASRRKAVISQVVYALGTAAVLTKGDMPVDVVSYATTA